MEAREPVLSVPELLHAIKGGKECEEFRAWAIALRDLSPQELLSQIKPCFDPLRIWVLHLELDKRGVPPCLRFPYRDENTQLDFMTWLADIYWLCKRYPTQKIFFNRLGGLLRHSPASESWHKTAIWVYLRRRNTGSLAAYFSKGLSLTEEQRQALATLPTQKMQADRRLLKRLPEFRERLFNHALNHPDKSARVTPAETMERRAEMLRLYLLAGRSPPTTAAYWQAIHGTPIKRQIVAHQIEQIQSALGTYIKK